MSPAIDFASVPSMDPVPNGVYLAEVVSAKEGTSQSSNPKIDLQWKIMGGEFDGRRVFDVMSFAPTALWRTKQTLEALGFKKGFSGEVTGEDLIGRQAVLTVTVDENTGINPDTGEAYGPRNKVVKAKATVSAGGSKSAKDLGL